MPGRPTSDPLPVTAGGGGGRGAPRWPASIAQGAVRWSFRSLRYDATVAFYRDLVRLPVLAEFTSSFGEDGTILGLPGTAVHLEVLRERSGDASSIGHAELVVYLDGLDALHAATAGLREAGVVRDAEGHPYWEANHAVTYRDPDGRAVVFAPWVFGRDADPVDRPDAGAMSAADDDPVRIDRYDGDRQALRALFEEAEDSAAQLDSYIGDGRVIVARVADDVVGHLQLVDTRRDREIELKSVAVAPEWRGSGIGRRLVEHAVESSRADGYRQMVVATAAADIDNLRFYQRRGFRLSAVEQDAFGPGQGYEDGLTIDGIPLRDRVWFARTL